MKATIVGYVVVALVFFLLGSMVTWQCGKEDVPLATIDTLMVREFIHDTSVVYDTVVISKYDTLFIEPTTPIGDIPTRVMLVQDSLPIDVYGQRVFIPFDLGMTYRGILYSYYLQTRPQEFSVQRKSRLVDFTGSVGGYYRFSRLITIDGQVDLVFKQHYSLSGKIEAKQERNLLTNVVEWKGGYGVGFRYWF